MICVRVWIVLGTLCLAVVASGATLEVQQVISREHPSFNVAESRLNLGATENSIFPWAIICFG